MVRNPKSLDHIAQLTTLYVDRRINRYMGTRASPRLAFFPRTLTETNLFT